MFRNVKRRWADDLDLVDNRLYLIICERESRQQGRLSKSMVLPTLFDYPP